MNGQKLKTVAIVLGAVIAVLMAVLAVGIVLRFGR